MSGNGVWATRKKIASRLAEIGDVESEGGEPPAALSCYFRDGGGVHVWCRGPMHGWHWWIVTLEAGGIPRSSKHYVIAGLWTYLAWKKWEQVGTWEPDRSAR